MSALQQLDYINVEYNELTGPVLPPAISGFSNLKEILFRGNLFTGPMDDAVSALKSLEKLCVHFTTPYTARPTPPALTPLPAPPALTPLPAPPSLHALLYLPPPALTPALPHLPSLPPYPTCPHSRPTPPALTPALPHLPSLPPYLTCPHSRPTSPALTPALPHLLSLHALPHLP
ncbi:unnamed protein product [Closterium sp. Naga37s-1]|nr:unnamed protein product [Closterium sp. Naga37s-1]